MQCEYRIPDACDDAAVDFLDLGDGPLSTVLSFLELADVPKTSSTCHTMNRLCGQEWIIRDAMLPTQTRSKAKTPKERLHRLSLGQEMLDAATCSFLTGTPSVPQHVILKSNESSETMLRLYSMSKQSVLWDGFLPLKEQECGTKEQQSQGSSIGWQLDVTPLAHFWSQMVKPLSTSALSSLEVVSQLVEDLVVIVVDVSQGKGATLGARLVACTQGVALSQRQHSSEFGGGMGQRRQESPSTFVLRQQVVQGMPVVVHLSLRSHADVLDEINVSYFCLR